MVQRKLDASSTFNAAGHTTPGERTDTPLQLRAPGAPRTVLYVVTQSAPGGAQRYVLDLATSLPERYQALICAGCDGGGGLLEEAQRAGIGTFTLPALHRSISPFSDSHAVTELRSLFQRVRPAIIHLNSTKAGVLGSLASRNTYRTVYTVHGWVFREQLPAWKKYAYMAAEKLSAHYLDGIIVLSGSDYAAGLKLRIRRDKLRVIHNGIGMPQFLSREIARARIEELCATELSTKRLILCIASFYPTKGLTTLVKAMADVDSSAVAVVLGEGELRSQLEQQICSLGLQQRVLLPGHVSNAAELLEAADVFVLPSVKEGMPYVILEAMAAKVPVVATDVGGIRELLSHCIVNASRADELAQALNKQLAAPHPVEYPPPTLAEMVDQTVAFYDEIMQRRQADQR